MTRITYNLNPATLGTLGVEDFLDAFDDLLMQHGHYGCKIKMTADDSFSKVIDCNGTPEEWKLANRLGETAFELLELAAYHNS